LRPVDVRELSNLGLIVDSSDEFIELDDVIKVKEVYGFSFDLIGLEVIDDKKHKLGKVQAYNLDSGSFSVEQLVVKRPLLRSLNDSELLIARSQIVEVSDRFIMVKSGAAKQEPVAQAIREYANPFRSSSPQPETTQPQS
jgi:sporulation protein YlmC with PRC-barrel domain